MFWWILTYFDIFSHSKWSYKIHFIFLLLLHFFPEPFICSFIVSAASQKYFLLLLYLKVYDDFIPYVSAVVIWLLYLPELWWNIRSFHLRKFGIWWFTWLQQVKLWTTVKPVELVSALFKWKEEKQTLNLPKHFSDLWGQECHICWSSNPTMGSYLNF